MTKLYPENAINIEYKLSSSATGYLLDLDSRMAPMLVFGELITIKEFDFDEILFDWD